MILIGVEGHASSSSNVLTSEIQCNYFQRSLLTSNPYCRNKTSLTSRKNVPKAEELHLRVCKGLRGKYQRTTFFFFLHFSSFLKALCQPGVLLSLLYSGLLYTVTLGLAISFPRRRSLKGEPGKGRPEVNEPRGGIGIGLPENIL